MHALSSFDYGVLRIVPRVERGEFVNAGVILFCPELRFLAARTHLNRERLRALWPDVDADMVAAHLAAFMRVALGEADAGPIARLSQRERFHWLVSPRSTVIQVSPVHSGLCDDPQAMLERLFERLA